MPELIVYTEDGRESINSNKVPLLALEFIDSGPRGNVVSSRYFPLTTEFTLSNPPKNSRSCAQAYTSSRVEKNKLVFIKPAVVGNGIRCVGMYANGGVNSYYSVTDVTNSGNYRLHTVLADVSNEVPVSGYFNIYEDTDAHKLVWSMETFRCGVSVLAALPINSMIISYAIPPWVDKNELYISVPHTLIYDHDNGTDPYYDISDITMQIIGDVAYVRCNRATESGINRSPRYASMVVFAVIKKALTSTIKN